MWLTIPEGKIPDYVYSGNTIEEAAKKAGLDGIELEKTIEKYNKDVANGVDTEFGRQHLEGKTGKLVKSIKLRFLSSPLQALFSELTAACSSTQTLKLLMSSEM